MAGGAVTIYMFSAKSFRVEKFLKIYVKITFFRAKGKNVLPVHACAISSLHF